MFGQKVRKNSWPLGECVEIERGQNLQAHNHHFRPLCSGRNTRRSSITGKYNAHCVLTVTIPGPFSIWVFF